MSQFSFDIANNNNDFEIFKREHGLRDAFITDLFEFLDRSPILINAILVDKVLARKRGWIQREKMIYETAENLIRNFILMTYAKGNVKGRIIAESSSDKDPHYLRAFNYFQSTGVPGSTLTHEDVKNCMTSISFVTKNNNDIETQVSDLLAYGAKCKFMQKMFKSGSYEERITKIFNKKIFTVHPNTNPQKRKILNKVDPYLVLPHN